MSEFMTLEQKLEAAFARIEALEQNPVLQAGVSVAEGVASGFLGNHPAVAAVVGEVADRMGTVETILATVSNEMKHVLAGRAEQASPSVVDTGAVKMGGGAIQF